MSYELEAGEVNAKTRLPEDVPSLVYPSGTTIRYVATGDVTNGQFGLFEYDMAPLANGAMAHFHRTFSESFYILSGTVEILTGEDWISATAGSFFYVAEGGIHGFRNNTTEPASMLILFSPGRPREQYFDELSVVLSSGRPLSEQQWQELYNRHDQYQVQK